LAETIFGSETKIFLQKAASPLVSSHTDSYKLKQKDGRGAKNMRQKQRDDSVVDFIFLYDICENGILE
jgi:hypothetical protein